MNMKYCFIINPASGKTDTKKGLEDKIRKASDEVGADVTVLYTQKSGDATDLVLSFYEQNKDEELRFFACGGDGTLCETVNGIMSIPCRDKISFGVVPVGTGNDFVRNFGGGEPFFDISAQLAAIPFEMDLIKYNDKYAVNMVNIGFDCQVVVRTHSFKAHVPSKLAYICGLVATLIKKPGVCLRAVADGGESSEKELLLCTFANGQFCGGGFHSNPNATLNDGRINALFVKNVSRTRFIRLVGSYKSGTHLVPKNGDVLEESFASVYELDFDGQTNISVDGEIVSVESLRLECERNAIKFLVPKGAALSEQPREAEATV